MVQIVSVRILQEPQQYAVEKLSKNREWISSATSVRI